MKNCGHRSLTGIVNPEMSPRLLDTTKWLWCILAFSVAPTWKPVSSVTVGSPPNTPSTVEAQAKFFQDFFSVQLSPYKMEFGHVCEDPNTWEQRYEKKDFKNHRDMGKVRWGDKHGGYGEHYWDLNHAGHADNHHDDGDDGSHSVHDNEDPYDEPSEQQPTYDDEYDTEQAAKYDESNRTKRHHRVKAEKKGEEEVKTLRRKARGEKKKTKEELDEKPEEYQNHRVKAEKKGEEEEEVMTLRRKSREEKENTNEKPYKKLEEHQKYKPARLRYKPRELNYDEDQQNPNSPMPTTSQPPQRLVSEQPEDRYVPYESGAGVRQHQQYQHAEVAAASAPRLFLEPSTGHVVDRATGQAYILQPIAANFQ